jgi:hypothetical protein
VANWRASPGTFRTVPAGVRNFNADTLSGGADVAFWRLKALLSTTLKENLA